MGGNIMGEAGYSLVLGDKNFSSWSLRPWLLMRMLKIPFEEINVDIYQKGARARVLEHSPSGKVPALKTGSLTIWDTLAIFEYLSEGHPEIAIWPKDRDTRAMARVVSAEMHSGFEHLRTDMPMDLVSSKPAEEVSKGVGHDVTRIVSVLNMCRETYGTGGDFLFGDFCAADAMFAPVTSRFRTYGLDLSAHGDDGTAQAYCDTILSLPAIEEWTQGGREQMAERGIAY